MGEPEGEDVRGEGALTSSRKPVQVASSLWLETMPQPTAGQQMCSEHLLQMGWVSQGSSEGSRFPQFYRLTCHSLKASLRGRCSLFLMYLL